MSMGFKAPTLAFVCLAVSASAEAGVSGPKAELDHLLQPWRKAASWLNGNSAQIHVRRRSMSDVEEENEGELTEEEEEEAKKEAGEVEVEAEAEAVEESNIKWGYVVGILALGSTFIGGYILEQNHIHYLPEAGVGVLMGALVAGMAIMMGNEAMAKHDQFDFEFFMTFLIPPIIFEAGYNMNVGAFLNNLGPTIFFAFVGTVFSCFVVGFMVWEAGQMGLCYPMSMLASLTFGSLISATDPVTVLAVFQALGVKVDLFSMVFGESVLNDAVAIVLSRTLLSFNKPGTEVNSETILAACASFTIIFVGSLIIGAFFGIASALVFKMMDMRHHADLVFMQCALSFTFPWSAFYFAEALELSGIVAIMFCGMIMAVYTRFNFHEDARKLTAGAYKCVAVVAETYVFVYLGMAAFTFPIFHSTTFGLVLCALVACFVGRVHIYIGSWMFNCFRTPESHPPTISKAYMFLMWFSGLRGGVAFALSAVSFASKDFPTTCGGLIEELKLDRPECQDSSVSDSLAIMQTTFLIAAFTIFVFGGAIHDVCVHFGVLSDEEFAADLRRKEEEAAKLEGDTMHDSFLLPFLTYHIVETSELRSHEAVIPHEAVYHYEHTDVPKAHYAKAAMSIMDKLDEMRLAMPNLTSAELKKLLKDARGDYMKAIESGKSPPKLSATLPKPASKPSPQTRGALL
jgi:solute carrier family 9 (sodium/hydrogen exchanger), member 8